MKVKFMSATKNISIVSDTTAPISTYTSCANILGQAITRLEDFFAERKEILNDRDLVQVQDTIDTAKFLRILIAENRASLDFDDVQEQFNLIKMFAFTTWTGKAIDVAVVDVVKVYQAERNLVALFYTAKSAKFSFFR